MHEIIISGATGTGKTLYAEHLESSARRAGLKVAVSDHELFSSHKEFSRKLEEIKNSHRSEKVEISIFVVNDGGDSLRVDFGGSVSHHLAGILFSST